MGQILTSIEDGVVHVIFNRQERKNALTNEMYEVLVSAIEDAKNDPKVKVLLFSGAGGVFTAGNDLDGFVETPPRTLDAPVFRFLSSLAAFPKPAIAAVEGLAIGIGTTMLLHCDLVYVADNVRFSLPFVKLGLVPEAASSLLLPKLCGHQRAAEKLFLGEPFSADEAHGLGFVNLILPAGKVIEHAMANAQKITRLPSGSLRDTKALMKVSNNKTVQTQIELEVASYARRLDGPAVKEAIHAFKEKRRPDFSDIE